VTGLGQAVRREAPHREPGAHPSLREFVTSSGLQSVVMGASKDPNAKVTVLLLPRGTRRPILAAKAPTTDRAALAVGAEAEMLAHLGSLRTPLLLRTVPKLVELAEYDGRPALVMSALPGTPMTTSYLRGRHTSRRGCVTADFAAVGAWLAALQDETAAERAPLDMDGGVLDRLSARYGGDAGIGGDLERLAGVYGRLAAGSTPRTVVHGDLWVGNVLLADGRVSGVVDWEAGERTGEPVRDLVRFPLMYALYLDRRARRGRRVAGHPGLRATRWGAGVEHAMDGTGWFPDLFRAFLQDGLTRLGASPAHWRDAVLAGIAEAAACMDDPEFGRLQLELLRRLMGEAPD
jgi:hypothetical protein